MSDNTTSSQRGWAQSLLITGIQELWSFGECSALIYGHFLASESAWRALCVLVGMEKILALFPLHRCYLKKTKTTKQPKNSCLVVALLIRHLRWRMDPGRTPDHPCPLFAHHTGPLCPPHSWGSHSKVKHCRVLVTLAEHRTGTTTPNNCSGRAGEQIFMKFACEGFLLHPCPPGT